MPSRRWRLLAGEEVSPGVFEPRLGGVDRSTVAVIPLILIILAVRTYVHRLEVTPTAA